MFGKIRRLLIFSLLSSGVLTVGASEEYLYLHTASFSFRNGIPSVRVQVSSFSAPLTATGKISLSCGGSTVSGEKAVISVNSFSPAAVRYRIAVEELTGDALAGYKNRLAKTAEEMGMPMELFPIGGIFSIGERRIDNREYYIVLAEVFDDRDKALARQETLRSEYPGRQILLLPVFVRPAESILAAATAQGALSCKDFIEISPESSFRANDMDVPVRTRRFLYAADEGHIGLVTEEDVESLLYRILPGEMFASAPLETLKAQAVAARTDIFMQLGKRHIGDPFHICSDVHCQKLDWRSQGVASKFREAVDSTRGEILLYKDLYVARAPYSSSCGGHTEAIEHVWFSAPKPYLGGVWDSAKPQKYNLSRGSDVRKFLEEGEGDCAIALNKRFRWQRDITVGKMDALVSSLGVGHVTDIRPLERGVSGRIWKLLFTGEKGERAVWGELSIRKLLDELPSSLFVVDFDTERKVWQFKGAGWGHGVGMCQMGAIGLGQKGERYQAILRRYYPGTAVTKIY